MTTPGEHDAPPPYAQQPSAPQPYTQQPSAQPPYAPPHGSAPAYSDSGYGAGYGGGPGDETASPSPSEPAPPPPAAERPSGRGRRGPALLLVACLLSGGVGGAVVHALEGGSSSPTAATVAPVVRGTAAAPQTATPGTAQAAAAGISPSVVTIAVTGSTSTTGALGQRDGQAVSDTGSGIVLDGGYVVTNNHVVAAAVGGGTVSVTFSDGSTSPAKIVGTDASSDLAVVKVDKSGLTPAVFADSDKLAVGQPVLAVGAPLGLSNTVTEGIVSTLHRPVRTGEAGASEQSVIDAVQTDAAINPGNSGGALVDLAGQVVGVNSAIATTGGGSASGGQSGNIGVGFAIPANTVAKVAQQLIANGRATHPQIGISAGDAMSASTGTPGQGAVVRAVTAGGPAAAAGLQEGDIITKLDNRVVTDADTLIVAIRSHDPGQTVTLTFLRGGASQTATAQLAEAPAR